MKTILAGALRRTTRGVVASGTRSCALQSSGKRITTTAAARVPFAPDRALDERAGIWIKVALTPSGVPASTIFVQGDRTPGGTLPPGPATQRSYPIQ